MLQAQHSLYSVKGMSGLVPGLEITTGLDARPEQLLAVAVAVAVLGMTFGKNFPPLVYVSIKTSFPYGS